MNEEDKTSYTISILILFLVIISFIGGFLTHKIHFIKNYPSIFITHNESSQGDIFKIKCENNNISEIRINLADLQKTNVTFFTNYVILTNYTVIYSNDLFNFEKISKGMSINPPEKVTSTDIDVNTLTNKVSDSDLDKISTELKDLIEEIQNRK